jgi:hypothetical protein
MGTLITETLAKIKPTEPFRLTDRQCEEIESDPTPRQFIDQGRCLTMSVQEKQTDEGTKKMANPQLLSLTYSFGNEGLHPIDLPTRPLIPLPHFLRSHRHPPLFAPSLVLSEVALSTIINHQSF